MKSNWCNLSSKMYVLLNIDFPFKIVYLVVLLLLLYVFIPHAQMYIQICGSKYFTEINIK